MFKGLTLGDISKKEFFHKNAWGVGENMANFHRQVIETYRQAKNNRNGQVYIRLMKQYDF